MSRRVNILLVEDELDMREVLVEFLTEDPTSFPGWELLIKGVASHAEAKASIEDMGRRGKRFDLILLDYYIRGAPRKSARDFILWFRTRRGASPILLCTAASNMDQADLDLVQGIIPKPFDLNALIDHIKKGVEKSEEVHSPTP
jgi:response regulator of citrate/malate metabolism